MDQHFWKPILRPPRGAASGRRRARRGREGAREERPRRAAVHPAACIEFRQDGGRPEGTVGNSPSKSAQRPAGVPPPAALPSPSLLRCPLNAACWPDSCSIRCLPPRCSRFAARHPPHVARGPTACRCAAATAGRAIHRTPVAIGTIGLLGTDLTREPRQPSSLPRRFRTNGRASLDPRKPRCGRGPPRSLEPRRRPCTDPGSSSL